MGGGVFSLPNTHPLCPWKVDLCEGISCGYRGWGESTYNNERYFLSSTPLARMLSVPHNPDPERAQALATHRCISKMRWNLSVSSLPSPPLPLPRSLALSTSPQPHEVSIPHLSFSLFNSPLSVLSDNSLHLPAMCFSSLISFLHRLSWPPAGDCIAWVEAAGTL